MALALLPAMEVRAPVGWAGAHVEVERPLRPRTQRLSPRPDQAPLSTGARESFSWTASIAANVAALPLAAIPLAAVAEGSAIFENAAAEGDVGVRPTIGGVNLFVFYAISQVIFQIYLRLRPGGPNVAFINGTKITNGRRSETSKFNLNFDETVKQAMEATKRMHEEGGNGSR
eukprot:scaffold243928_cov32-Tisochrysis_lutea.AAC.3